jgi:hypothetical protein
MSNTKMQEFINKCELFNTIAGKDGVPTKISLYQQLMLIREELNETIHDLEAGDMTGVLDGYTDIAVTWAGFGQMLDSLGMNTEDALIETANNNLTKFVPISSNDEVIDTINMYADKGQTLIVETYTPASLYVFKDENNKVKKPKNFVSNDVSKFVGKCHDLR